jgi:ActR/RegA family two-component response regulator
MGHRLSSARKEGRSCTVRLLFVDDEAALRETLPAVLSIHGFEVTATATVAQALAKIASEPFEVLIADLNIGQPGDGFTVVSAMRRTQPNCATFILTGYPALETALQAIRSQVDGYLIKPADIPELIATIEQSLANRHQHPLTPTRRLAEILRDNLPEIVKRMLQQMKSQPALRNLRLSDGERADVLVVLIRSLAEQLESEGPARVPEQVLRAAFRDGAAMRSHDLHCVVRCSSGYDVVTLMQGFRLFERVVFQVAHENLLSIDLSFLMLDLKRLNDILGMQSEEIVAAFLGRGEPAA